MQNSGALSDGRMVRRLGLSLTEVAVAASDAEAFCAARGVAEGQALRIGLALDELAANAMTHGAEAETAPDILVEVWVDPRFAHLRISANGPPFDPRAPRIEDGAASPLGGRGLSLVLAFADQLAYLREEARNITTFSVFRVAPNDV